MLYHTEQAQSWASLWSQILLPACPLYVNLWSFCSALGRRPLLCEQVLLIPSLILLKSIPASGSFLTCIQGQVLNVHLCGTLKLSILYHPVLQMWSILACWRLNSGFVVPVTCRLHMRYAAYSIAKCLFPTLRDHGLFLPCAQYINCFRHFIFLLLFQAGEKN